MSRRSSFSSDPTESAGFAVIMALAAFLGRENPNFVYPQVLWAFIAVLVFNFVHLTRLMHGLDATRRSQASVAANTLLLSIVIQYSGAENSAFWVTYLLPIFTACIALDRSEALKALLFIACALVFFHLDAIPHAQRSGLFELLVKLATLGTSAAVVMRVAFRERESSQRLADETRRMERERLEMRENIQHMDRLVTLGTLTAGITHELNTPLTTILGFAQICSNPDLPASELRNGLSRIESSTKRCKQIIEDMLAFSRQKKILRRPCDINALVAECVLLKKNDWGSQDISIKEDYAPALPSILLSGSEFQQVVFNLINNAYQAIRSTPIGRGLIEVSTRLDSDKVRVVVRDDGPGIPEAIMGRIGEPFFTTKAEGKGTGLGLSICRQIVEKHGGSLTVSSEAGHGTTFTITLKAVEPSVSAVKAGTPPRRSNAAKILILEDDAGHAELLHRLLAPQGLPIAVCGSFDDGLAAIKAEIPKFLIADVHMPGMTAMDFFRELESLSILSSVRTLIVSGSPLTDEFEAYLKSKNIPFLPKPYESAAFQEKARALLEN